MLSESTATLLAASIALNVGWLSGGQATDLPTRSFGVLIPLVARLMTPSGAFWNCVPMILNGALLSAIALIVERGAVSAISALPDRSTPSGITSGPPGK